MSLKNNLYREKILCIIIHKMPKVSKNSKKNIRNLKRKMIGGSLEEEIKEIVARPEYKELISTYYNNKPKGLEYIWSQLKEKNLTKYGLYFNEVQLSFGCFGGAIIWDKDRCGEFDAGTIFNYTDDAGRTILYMLTKKSNGNRVLFINAQNSNHGGKSKEGYPVSIQNIENKAQAFLTQVHLEKNEPLNVTQVILTGDMNDKFGVMLTKGIKIEINEDINGTKFETTIRHELPTNDPRIKSCCPNWDSSGEPLSFTKDSDEKITYPAPSFNPVYPPDLDFSDETKRMLQETYGYQLEASEIDSQGNPIKNEEKTYIKLDENGNPKEIDLFHASNNKTIPGLLAKFKKGNQVSGEAFKGDLLTGLERPCAGNKYRYDFSTPQARQINNYKFYGDYAYICNNGQSEFTGNNLSQVYRPDDKDGADPSKCSDHELVFSETNGVVGSYNMSFASDLGNLGNKTLFTRKAFVPGKGPQDMVDGDALRQESEIIFLLQLHKEMKEKPEDPTLGSRSYFLNAVANLMNFITTKDPVAVGLQEMNLWKNYGELIKFNPNPAPKPEDVCLIGQKVALQDIANFLAQKNKVEPPDLSKHIMLDVCVDEDIIGRNLLKVDKINYKDVYTQSENTSHAFDDLQYSMRSIKDIAGASTNLIFHSEYEWLYFAEPEFKQEPLVQKLQPLLVEQFPYLGNDSYIVGDGDAYARYIDITKDIDTRAGTFDKLREILTVAPPISGAAAPADGGKKSHRRSSVAHKKSTASHKSAVAKLFQASSKNVSKIPDKKSLKMVKVRSSPKA